MAMTVNLRVNRSQNGAAGHRGRAGRELGWRTRRTWRPTRALTPNAESPEAVGFVAARGRPGPPPQDRALYACSCGFVFSQDVSTSVSCPHCGGTQAW